MTMTIFNYHHLRT